MLDLISMANQENEGFFLKDISSGSEVRINTKNSIYILKSCQENECMLIGGTYQSETPVYIRGSTWGGSVIKVGWIGIGMHLEVFDKASKRTFTTSKIQTVYIYDNNNKE